MEDWFQIQQLDDATYVISEPKHYEETNSYLLLGTQRALLIDSGLGVADMRTITNQLTALTVTVVATHVHWNHIGSHGSYDTVLVHELERRWLEGDFPLPPAVVRSQLLKEPYQFPKAFNADAYTVWQGHVSGIVQDGDILDLGERRISILHTPGHAPGHMCFVDMERSWLYSGDLLYKGTLYCDYPSTEPLDYLHSLQRLCTLAIDRILPAHHTLNIPVTCIQAVTAAWEDLQKKGLPHHGSGQFSYEDFSIRL